MTPPGSAAAAAVYVTKERETGRPDVGPVELAGPRAGALQGFPMSWPENRQIGRMSYEFTRLSGTWESYAVYSAGVAATGSR